MVVILALIGFVLVATFILAVAATTRKPGATLRRNDDGGVGYLPIANGDSRAKSQDRADPDGGERGESGESGASDGGGGDGGGGGGGD